MLGDNRFQRQPRGRRPQPERRVIVVHQVSSRNAQLDLEVDRQLNIHLLCHNLQYFEGETRGYGQKAVVIEDSPFNQTVWYELVITLTRPRTPEEIVKNKHLKSREKGKPVLIKIGKPFRYDIRKDNGCMPDIFKVWLRDQNLPESLWEKVQEIVCSWVENKCE